MKKVQLDVSQLREDAMRLITIFVKAADAQGFDVEYVEAVLAKAVA